MRQEWVDVIDELIKELKTLLDQLDFYIPYSVENLKLLNDLEGKEEGAVAKRAQREITARDRIFREPILGVITNLKLIQDEIRKQRM